MKKAIAIHLSITVVALALLAGFHYYSTGDRTTAFIDNQKLFNGYRGTKELQDRLLTIQSQQQQVLDSLTAAIDSKVAQLSASGGNEALMADIERSKREYSKRIEEFTAFFRTKEDEYTQQAWKQINQYVFDFGASEGYEYIIGANGDGSLMYAREANDITEEVLGYINSKYDGVDQ